jgi:hypothetical protein
MRWQEMPQDHNVRNRNHYVDFNCLRLHRSIAPIELIRGTYHAYRAYHALVLGAAKAFTIPPVSYRHLVRLVSLVRTFSARHPKDDRTLSHAETRPLDKRHALVVRQISRFLTSPSRGQGWVGSRESGGRNDSQPQTE